MADAAPRLTTLAEQLLGAPLPVRIRAWDGSARPARPAPPSWSSATAAPCAGCCGKPGELGLARAWVAGDLDVDGDLYEALDLMAGLLWERGDADGPRRASPRSRPARPRVRAAVRGLLRARRARCRRPPRPARRSAGAPRHRCTPSAATRQAISHHYDVGNDFYELVLGPSMVYSCAYWETPSDGTLEDAQRDKLDLVCRKLGLQPGQRLLDVGCGWGSMALHAAREYGVERRRHHPLRRSRPRTPASGSPRRG